MPDVLTEKSILDHLFSQPGTNVYTVLDGASVKDLREMLWEREPEHVCLYAGELKPDMADVAPYLIKMEPVSPFSDWVLRFGWGNHWGVFAVTPARVGMPEASRHFRRFLMVKDPEGNKIYFRWYDPRVLRAYLPTCNTEELEFVFGPMDSYFVEGEDKTMLLRFALGGRELQTERIALTQ